MVEHRFGIKACVALVLVWASLISGGVFATEQDPRYVIAEDLTVLFRAARSTFVSHPDLMTNATQSSVTVDEFMAETIATYQTLRGKPLAEDQPLIQSLLRSIKGVIASAKKGQYKNKWPEGEFKNRFIPARFGREVSVRFNFQTWPQAAMRITAPDAYLVNPLSKADEWERMVMENHFSQADWVKGEVFAGEGVYRDKQAYRVALPEYYTEACLACHGGEVGQRIHQGKIEGHLGDLGAIISVVVTDQGQK